MGGHAAEELIFGHSGATTGASSDFQRATALAVSMVAQLGMSEIIGKLSINPEDFANWSPFLKKQVLAEARKVTDNSYERVTKLLTDNRSVLDKLVNEVSRKDTLSQTEIYEIAGLCPHEK